MQQSMKVPARPFASNAWLLCIRRPPNWRRSPATYLSDEAETTFTLRVRDGVLEATQRPDKVYRLMPLYADAFSSDLGTIIFRRDGEGHPDEFSVVEDRVWDLRFQRQ